MRKFSKNLIELLTFKFLVHDVPELLFGTAIDYYWTSLDYNKDDRIIGWHSLTVSYPLIAKHDHGPSLYEIVGGFETEVP
jgi:hypothetical protein